jgi:hypothetical protein
VTPISLTLCFTCFSPMGTTMLPKSISCGAQYVILHSEIGWRKVKTCRFGSRQLFWLCIIAHFRAACERCNNVVAHTPPWKECNKYDLMSVQYFWLAPHNDWSRWFAISSSSPPISCFSFVGGVATN